MSGATEFLKNINFQQRVLSSRVGDRTFSILHADVIGCSERMLPIAGNPAWCLGTMSASTEVCLGTYMNMYMIVQCSTLPQEDTDRQPRNHLVTVLDTSFITRSYVFSSSILHFINGSISEFSFAHLMSRHEQLGETYVVFFFLLQNPHISRHWGE